MKKEFLTPSMNIAKFDIENIVTGSQPTAQTNVELAEAEIKGEVEALTTVKLTW